MPPEIVYNFGLSECNRVERKTIVLSKDIKIIIFFAIFSYFFFTAKSKYMHFEKNKVFNKKKKKKKDFYLLTLIFSGCNLNHTFFLFGLIIWFRDFISNSSELILNHIFFQICPQFNMCICVDELTYYCEVPYKTETKVVWPHLKVFWLSKDNSSGHSARKKKR